MAGGRCAPATLASCFSAFCLARRALSFLRRLMRCFSAQDSHLVWPGIAVWEQRFAFARRQGGFLLSRAGPVFGRCAPGPVRQALVGPFALPACRPNTSCAFRCRPGTFRCQAEQGWGSTCIGRFGGLFPVLALGAAGCILSAPESGSLLGRIPCAVRAFAGFVAVYGFRQMEACPVRLMAFLLFLDGPLGRFGGRLETTCQWECVVECNSFRTLCGAYVRSFSAWIYSLG